MPTIVMSVLQSAILRAPNGNEATRLMVKGSRDDAEHEMVYPAEVKHEGEVYHYIGMQEGYLVYVRGRA